MSAPTLRHPPGPRQSSWIAVAILAMVAIPAAITLNTVRFPGTLQMANANPTPYGYTWSLLLFVVPIVVIAGWMLPSEGIEVPRSAFWRTIGMLAPLGFGTDFFFANRFFTFSNAGATLQIGAPALGGKVPVEEYVFYLTGFLVVLLMYIWLDEFWLAAYNVPDYGAEAKQLPRLVRFHPTSVILGVVLIVAGILYKKFISPSPDGFPAYFTFLVAAAFVPASGFFPTARPFINWRAFSLTLVIIVLVSLIWEATLAVPYGGWGYQSRQMVGLRVWAWSGLPIEAVGVWITVTYTTVIVFEITKLWLASGKPAKTAFLGERR
jgi:hypothetical protein